MSACQSRRPLATLHAFAPMPFLTRLCTSIACSALRHSPGGCHNLQRRLPLSRPARPSSCIDDLPDNAGSECEWEIEDQPADHALRLYAQLRRPGGAPTHRAWLARLGPASPRSICQVSAKNARERARAVASESIVCMCISLLCSPPHTPPLYAPPAPSLAQTLPALPHTPLHPPSSP
jgi:hypothetical protein